MLLDGDHGIAGLVGKRVPAPDLYHPQLPFFQHPFVPDFSRLLLPFCFSFRTLYSFFFFFYFIPPISSFTFIQVTISRQETLLNTLCPTILLF